MAASTFRLGKVQIGANVMSGTEGQLVITWNTEDVTDMGEDWQSHAALLRSWTASGTAKFDRSNTAQALIISEFINGDGKLTSVLFYYTDSEYFKGSVLVTGATVNKARGAVDTLAWSFMGNAALSRT